MRNGDWLITIIEASNRIPWWIGVIIFGFLIRLCYAGADKADHKAGRVDPNPNPKTSNSNFMAVVMIAAACAIAYCGTKFYGG